MQKQLQQLSAVTKYNSCNAYNNQIITWTCASKILIVNKNNIYKQHLGLKQNRLWVQKFSVIFN